MEIEGHFTLREILFVLQKKICQRETVFNANDLFDPPKFSQVPPSFSDTIENLLFHDRYPSTGHHIS